MYDYAPYTIVVDGSYFLHRTYHAVPPQYNRKGVLTNAVYGVVNAIHRVLDRYNPEYMVVVFDHPTKTFRHELSPAYKADRPPHPEELVIQLGLIQDVLKALGVPVVSIAGHEGDDLIGTLAFMAADNGQKVMILTGDKDIAQLVDNDIVIEDYFKDVRYDIEGVYCRFNVYPDQIADMLALMGDKCDGIKGVTGIGAKGAAGLLGQYKTLDAVIENIPNMRGHTGRLLSAGLEDLALSRQLTKIVTDLPIDYDLDKIRLQPSDVQALKTIYDELGFQQFYYYPRF